MKYIYRLMYFTENNKHRTVIGNEYIPLGYYTSFDKAIKELQKIVDLYPNQLIVLNYPEYQSGLSLYDSNANWVHCYYVEKILLDHEYAHWLLHSIEPLYYQIR